MSPPSALLCSYKSAFVCGNGGIVLQETNSSLKPTRLPSFQARKFHVAATSLSRRKEAVGKVGSYSCSIKSVSQSRGFWVTKQVSFRRLEKQVGSRRGSKRALSLRSLWVHDSDGVGFSSLQSENDFSRWNYVSPTSPARKRFRCLAFEGASEEPLPVDLAALGAIEQAIKFQAKEESRLFLFGPPRGDLAEIEAFCRLHRLAESLQATVMDALRSYSTVSASSVAAGSGQAERGDVSLVEENVASRLVQLMTMLHTRKADILCGTRVGRPQVEAPLDEPSPFAKFRMEVRECCKPLETALESLLPADTEQRLAVNRSMLKLKNACLDSGYPRPEGLPKHADIPNLAVVRFRPSKSARTLHNYEEDVAFWRGGQITDEGLEWLLQTGFKMIVDLREETTRHIAAKAIDKAVAAGKLKVVRLHVDRGKQPTKEQVEEFARLVEDEQNKPLYLHTLAGVGRASAMVSSWREFVLYEKARERAERKVLTNGTLRSSSSNPKSTDIDNSEKPLVSASDEINSTKNGLVSNSVPSQDGGKEKVPALAMVSKETSSLDEGPSKPSVSKAAVLNGKLGSSPKDEISVFVPKNAFEAQRPPDVLYRPAMSRFMKRKKGPSVFLSGRAKAATKNPFKAKELSDIFESIAGPAGRWGLASPGIPRAENKQQPHQMRADEQGGARDTSSNIDSQTAADGAGERDGFLQAEKIERSVVSRDINAAGNEVEKRGESSATVEVITPNGALFQIPASDLVKNNNDGDEPVMVDGDMCASTTGVVRLQSRKKAEMFLVRTDGYSCTRERVRESTLAFTHPSTQQQMLMWKTPPRTCLVLKRLGDDLLPDLQRVASFLHHQEGMNIVVEPDVHDRLARLPGFGFVQTFYSQDTSELHERVDFVVCLGGDGVILHASNLFRSAVPPVVSFNLGSLGFLTAHPFNDFKEDLRAIIHGHSEMLTGVYITLRMRLRCELFRNGKAIPGKIFDVLNEVVVDRGSNPYLSKIECYERNRLITKVQADGVIVATPTGSTAYSTAAGGSMVHPNVPCMLFTPICPHSLSFRPVILPDSALVELKVPSDARNNAWVSFDGKKRQQLSKGDSVRIRMSEHPLPTVNKSDQTDDWFQSLVRCLNWNERTEQRPLNVQF
ncbi:hypothetical protein R1flu_016500 [Riccia fluitans]|uniref:NAD(+) kinase n=1 Tax=Riccia fluitans TaxID=41844 RepID=A0ABD1YN14_9MARC